MRKAIRATGAHRIFLPSCSPDIDPIEQVFAKLKPSLGKTAAWTIETVCAAIAELPGTYTAEGCTNHFRNAGNP